jgi:hypothetical protein
VWQVLRGILPDKPGGFHAVVAVLLAIARIKRAIAIALLALPALVLAGIVLVAIQVNHSLTIVGVVLVSAAGALTIVLVVGLWVISRAVRSLISKRLKAFVNPAV